MKSVFITVDNIYIGHSPADAKAFAEETWVPKLAAEKETDGIEDEEELAEAKLSSVDKLKLKALQFISKWCEGGESPPDTDRVGVCRRPGQR